MMGLKEIKKVNSSLDDNLSVIIEEALTHFTTGWVQVSDETIKHYVDQVIAEFRSRQSSR